MAVGCDADQEAGPDSAAALEAVRWRWIDFTGNSVRFVGNLVFEGVFIVLVAFDDEDVAGHVVIEALIARYETGPNRLVNWRYCVL